MRRIGADRIAESIVSGIARAARTLGVATIAEHVESAAVADRLRELDVTLGAGVPLRPAPAVRRDRPASSLPAPRGGSHDPGLSSATCVTFAGSRRASIIGAILSSPVTTMLRHAAACASRSALCAGAADAETAYVTDILRLGMHAARRYERPAVREPRQRHGRRGPRAQSELRARALGRWPRGLGQGRRILVAEKPAAARVLELEAEIGGFEGAAAAAKTAQAAAEHELARLRGELQATTGSAESIRRRSSGWSARTARTRSASRPTGTRLPLLWVVPAVVVALVAGFLVGLWWLDAWIRRRHGGFRVY